MCFSATSSFAVAGILAIAGGTSVTISRSKRIRYHAIIPLLFAVQQFFEGIVWLTLDSPPPQTLHYLAAYIFIFFAFLVWPIWLPSSLWMIENNRLKKTLLLVLTLNGTALTLWTFIAMFFYRLYIGIDSGHLMYYTDPISPLLKNTYLSFYSFSTVLPFFIASSPRAKYLGLPLFTSLLLSYIYENASFISVWCYFAAVISVMVVFLTVENRKELDVLTSSKAR